MNFYRILVIQDEADCRQALKELLEENGYKVRLSADGRQGLFDIIDFKPHLILCDIVMPRMNGYQVLEHVRKTPAVQNTSFMFLTACADKPQVRMGMELGADDYLPKPFTSRELLAAITTRLLRHSSFTTENTKEGHEVDTSIFATYYHEFNTPLHGILGGLNLLLTAKAAFSEEQAQELIKSILKSGRRLNHSLANLMLYEEIKRAEVYPDLQSMFMNGRSKATWVHLAKRELMTMAAEMYNRANDLSVSLSPGPVRAHSEYLQRILLELTDNALKFSSKGQKIAITGIAAGEDYIIEVKDLGRGFEITSLDAIKPFGQFNRHQFEQQGLGLGLYLVKRLADFANGEMQITSIAETGTKVMVVLPLEQTVEYSSEHQIVSEVAH